MNTKIARLAGGMAVLWAACLCRGQTPSASSAPALSTVEGLISGAMSSPAMGTVESPAAARAPRVDSLGDPLPPGAVARLGTVRLRYPSGALVVAFCPDGNSFAAGYADGAICIWERSTGRLLRRLAGHTQAVTGLVYAGKGLLVSGSGDKTLRWWDANGGVQVGKVDEPAGVSAMAMGPTGRSIVVAAGRSLQVFESATANRVDEVRLEKPVGESLAVIPGDDRVLVSSPDGNIHMIPMSARAEAGAIALDTKTLAVLAVSPAGRTLAWTEAGGKIRLADIPTGAQRKSLIGHLDTVHCLAFSPSGRLLASRGADGTVRLWNVAAARELWQADSCGDTMNSLAFSPDGNVLAVARADHALDLLDAVTGKPFFDLPGHTDSVAALSLSPDGRTLASGTSGLPGNSHDMIRVWDLGTLRQVWRTPVNYGFGARHIAWRADGKLLASSGNDRRVRVWSNPWGLETCTLPVQASMVTSLAFMPDADAVLISGQDGTGGIWTLEFGKVEGPMRFDGKDQNSKLVASSPDMRWVAVEANDCVRLFDFHGLMRPGDQQGPPAGTAPTRSLLDALSGHSFLRFSPDGSTLLGAGPRGMSLWDIPGGRLALSWPLGRRFLMDADLSPDGRLLLSTFSDGNIVLWETATGEVVRSWQQRGSAGSAAFLSNDPKGRGDVRFCTAGADTQILIWSLEELLGAPAAAPLTPEAMAECWRRLAEGPAAEAWGAQYQLAAGGERAALFIREHLKPLPAATQPAPLTSEMKRTLRAIAVLEAIGTESARRALESLAVAPGDSPAGRQARAALARLGAKPAP